MKKFTYFTLMGCLVVLLGLFSFTAPTSAAAAVSYTLYVDGTVSSAKTPVVVEKNVTLIPMKAVLADLKYVTTVDKKTKAITAKNSAGSYITVNLGSKKAKINGSNVNLAAAAKTLSGTTYIPLSAVKQLTGKPIGLDASEGVAWIGEKPATANLPVWGITPEQVKSAAGYSTLLDEGGQGDIYLLLYQDSMEDPEELYVFYKNKLAKVVFSPVISGLNEVGLVGFYDGAFDSLVKSYGQPITDVVGAYEDTLEQIPLLDGGCYMSEWKKGDTLITLLLQGTEDGYSVSMQYVKASIEAQVEAALDAIQ
ncbi:hypothetical protein DMN77_13890 [Paenibacillus sp. 79R4]|uniref:copper amine oxidase N-terminal domain-containing protein n=1 Tax=Paenibacillus sp. 79R4 TaxID=2212847 RepID=UPI0015C0A144|nr:copper amine oxidase N-terminal domain-containing protein [Paenibacillus sp. 79R4]NWL88659.1 hypothetical protein [Paenibacillus sp. 79R4]